MPLAIDRTFNQKIRSQTNLTCQSIQQFVPLLTFRVWGYLYGSNMEQLKQLVIKSHNMHRFTRYMQGTQNHQVLGNKCVTHEGIEYEGK